MANNKKEKEEKKEESMFRLNSVCLGLNCVVSALIIIIISSTKHVLN
jgi:hypothetical protein